VYQNGNPNRRKFEIIYSKPSDARDYQKGKWYILRCKKHDLDFDGAVSAIHSVGNHLNSGLHGFHRRRRQDLVAVLGIRVLNCDAAKADMNNKDVKTEMTDNRDARRGKRRAQSEQPQSQPAKPVAAQPVAAQPLVIQEPVQSPDDSFDRVITNPTEGALYYVPYGVEGLWAVVVLPPGDFTEVGVRGSVRELEDDVPECYKPDLSTGRLPWAEGFEDGGGREHHRWFVVKYFDPDAAFGWVPAWLLNEFDLSNPEIQGVAEAQAYLNERLLAKLEQSKPAGADGMNSDGRPGASDLTPATDDQKPPADGPMPMEEDTTVARLPEKGRTYAHFLASLNQSQPSGLFREQSRSYSPFFDSAKRPKVNGPLRELGQAPGGASRAPTPAAGKPLS